MVLADQTDSLYHSLGNGAKLSRQQSPAGVRIKGSDAEGEVAVDLRIFPTPRGERSVPKKRSRDPVRDPCLSFTRRRKEYLYYTA
jgi:hypothetical protein